MIGMGTGPITPCPNNRKESGAPKTAFAFVKM